MSFREQIIYMIILLVLSGFFSGSEVALISLSKFRVRHLLERKKAGAKYIKKLKDEPQRMLSTILIGNNLVNVAASAMATSIAISMFGSAGIGIATGIMTFLILVFGEITPKTIATQHNEAISLFVARPLWYMGIVLAPILNLLDIFVARITNALGITKPETTFTEEDVKMVLKEAEEEGTIKEIEKKMVHKIFEFDDINVREIMTPKADMVIINKKCNVKDIVNLYLKKHFSRVPVYENSKDNIVGIIYVKDVLPYLKKKKLSIPVQKIMKNLYFVPETKKIGNMLKQFQKRKEHMAIIVDEHGSVIGLVTLEDVVEEIVGEIMDETDMIDPDIRKINTKTWIVKGKADIDEVNQKLKIKIKEKGFGTLSGFILHHTGHIPKQNEEITFGKFTLKVEELEGNRISRVKVTKK